MTTVIFVHGTGVREPAFSKTFARVSTELHARSQELDVAPCYWGATAGARLWHDGASVPSYDATKGIASGNEDAPGSEDEEIALWGQLYADPLWELRMLALGGAQGGERPPHQESPGEELDLRVQALEPSGEFATALAAAGLADTFEAARRDVATAEPYRLALDAAGANLGDLRAAAARAIVAAALARQAVADDAAIPVVLDAAARDRVIVLLTDALGGKEMGLVDGAIRTLVLRPATALAARKRGAITDATTPAAGDIMLYQARGAAIREIIAGKIAGAAEPVVVVAHSLGGIAAVDLLAGQSFPKVRLLVTVGSQAPLLYEIGALVSLDHDQTLPAHMPRWLNVYDTRDLLSYVAAPLFPHQAEDVKVNNGQPFPQSHSAYWANPTVWDEIVARLP